MPATDEDLQFLVNKIAEIKTAVFKTEINSGLHLPNNIISTIRTDDEGNIWFFTSGSADHSKDIGQSFFAYLEYIQKDQHCRLRLSGKACIVSGDADTGITSVQPIEIDSSNIVLIKFKILYAEYFEDQLPAPGPMKRNGKTGLYGFLYSAFTQDVQFFLI